MFRLALKFYLFSESFILVEQWLQLLRWLVVFLRTMVVEWDVFLDASRAGFLEYLEEEGLTCLPPAVCSRGFIVLP